MHNDTLNTVLARLLRITTPKRHQKDISARRDIEHKAEFNIRHIVRAFPNWHINLNLSSSKTTSNIANFSYYQTEASLSTSYYF